MDAIQCFPLCPDYTVGTVETEMTLRRATVYLIKIIVPVHINPRHRRRQETLITQTDLINPLEKGVGFTNQRNVQLFIIF